MTHKILYAITLGDSLSDRGTANQALFLGFFPLVRWINLSGVSPKYRFTNGHVWSDLIATFWINAFLLADLKKKYKHKPADLADAIISKEKKITTLIDEAYTLTDDIYVKYKGIDFIRSYAEAGLSAASYEGIPSDSYLASLNRMILPTLFEKRAKLLAYDREQQLSKKHKEQTLVIEWTGANDLITVNARPSRIVADRILQERTKNLEMLIESGYKHFILFNLPDLSLTPRFQNLTGPLADEERENARQCILHFNQSLEKLKNAYPGCTIEIFDINKIFTDVYHNPQAYGFEQDKLKQSYKASKATDASGYMFWDDIHPTMHVHTILAQAFNNLFSKHYEIAAPAVETFSADNLQKKFIEAFTEKPFIERLDFFSNHIRTKSKSGLQETLQNAYHNNKVRTREVLIELEWIDQAGEVLLNNPELKAALAEMQFVESCSNIIYKDGRW